MFAYADEIETNEISVSLLNLNSFSLLNLNLVVPVGKIDSVSAKTDIIN